MRSYDPVRANTFRTITFRNGAGGKGKHAGKRPDESQTRQVLKSTERGLGAEAATRIGEAEKEEGFGA
jgi:hypothetical protein